ncbi:Small subunit (SSU) processome component [Dimargaris xerosporica]|nr:Small subunit (SSU) processome component [Dimargaris xerosporica]
MAQSKAEQRRSGPDDQDQTQDLVAYEQLRTLAEFDSAHKHLAFVSQDLNRHLLRLCHTSTGEMLTTKTPLASERITCLRWGQVAAKDASNGTTTALDGSSSSVIALGTNMGSIMLYSPRHQRMLATMKNCHKTPVTDYVFAADGTRAFSCSQDSDVIEWDLVSMQKSRQLHIDVPFISALQLSHKGGHLAVASTNIQLYATADFALVKSFTGHTQRVCQMYFTSDDGLLVSSAENDRHISVWDCNPDSSALDARAASLHMDSDVVQICLSPDNYVAARTENGTVGVWKDVTKSALSAANVVKSGSARKRQKATSLSPDSRLTIRTDAAAPTNFPIIRVAFGAKSGAASDKLYLAWGNLMRPMFENVLFTGKKGTSLMPTIALVRKPIESHLQLVDPRSRSLDQDRAPVKTEHVVSASAQLPVANGHSTTSSKDKLTHRHESDTDDDHADESLSIEEKLRRMGVEQDRENHQAKANRPATDRSSATPSSNSLARGGIVDSQTRRQLNSQTLQLIQGLHTHDNRILDVILGNREHKVICATVQQLSPEFVIPLLDELIHRLQSFKANQAATIQWIQTVLMYHTAYLISVPELVNQMQALYQVLEGRLAFTSSLTNLESRLSLVATQINFHRQAAARTKSARNKGVGKASLMNGDGRMDYPLEFSDDAAAELDSDDASSGDEDGNHLNDRRASEGNSDDEDDAVATYKENDLEDLNAAQFHSMDEDDADDGSSDTSAMSTDQEDDF